MTLALAALVLSSLNPSSQVSSAALAQGKVQIIKGKKGTVKAANANAENAPVPVVDSSSNNAAKTADLDRKSAELDAKNRDLSEREQALNEKQAAAAENDKKKAEQQKALQKKVEKISEGNDELWRQSSDALAGD